MSTITAKVALSQDFLTNLAKLPSTVHSKVLKWAIRFQADPTASSINYEKLNTGDPNLRSVRIDLEWRGIVFRSPDDNVFVLLYVDHHDEAYRWAAHRKMKINPVTGAMQLVVLDEVTESQEPGDNLGVQGAQTETRSDEPALFDSLSNKDLLSLGVPEDLLPKVRSLRGELDLDRIQGILPVEAYEGLFLYAAGDTLTQILQSRETRVDQTIDTEDFSESLNKAESQSRFVVVSSDEELTAILNAPLAQWRVFLHPTQKKLATGIRNGSMRVLGGAGTGKTVLVMHRAKWLAENATPDGQRVLVTTFTKNLAIDILENLRTLCAPETLQKIEVINLDAWVNSYLRSKKYEHRIVYNRRDDARDCWQRALAVADSSMDLAPDFYEKELEEIILAQGITTRDEYRTARRAGRGTVLTRAKRDLIWPVFEEYRAQLASRKLKEVDDAYRDAAHLLAKDPPVQNYSAVVVDETQDLSSQALRLLRTVVLKGPNDLFFVGDGHQRIYKKNKAAMSRCGIDIRGRSRKLYLNYRTTEEIRKAAVALLEGVAVDDLDEGHDELKRYKSLSHGPQPGNEEFSSLEEVQARAAEILSGFTTGVAESGFTACVICPDRGIRNQLQNHFQGLGVATHTIAANERDPKDSSRLRLATMHRAKGLEFDQVVVIARKKDLQGDDDNHERILVYVALTRARRHATLLSF
jgi:Txe/YoeB family toxin of Txe-Axe toxin-antitoxin module